MEDTYIVAKASGDQKFLEWLFERMKHVHKENPYTDYMNTLDNFREYFKRRSRIPRWLNFLLRKYGL